jgi:hypothetical protein
LIVLLLASAAIALDRSSIAHVPFTEKGAATTRRLTQAKAALVARAATIVATSRKPITPGLLPFPDRNRDGNYDGAGDCVTFGLNQSHLLGRLPWAGDVSPCPPIGLHIDVHVGAGEDLWYAVSRNLVTRGGGGPINPDMGNAGKMIHPWISLRTADGLSMLDPHTGNALPIAAVLIAPGAAVAGQDRGAVAPPPTEFLDVISIGRTTYSNADADGCPDSTAMPCESSSSGEEFVVYPHLRVPGVFNDRLAYISVDELMRAVEKRVLGEVAVALLAYRGAHGVYPWLAEFRDPRTSAFKSSLSRSGPLPVHLPGEIFSTDFSGTWDFIDTTPTHVADYSGYAALVPPIADLLSGRIEVTNGSGRCLWTDPNRADCRGSRTIANYYRPDLGISVTRTVEYSFSVVDEAPLVSPPTSGDARRRGLSINGAPLPEAPSLPADHPRLLPEVAWVIRITDNDGIDHGRREISIDSDTGGAISLHGIRFDLSVVYDDIDDERDELPEWFAENDWHHFIYAAFSSDAVAGGDADGDGDCMTPVNTCLILRANGVVARTDVRALLISAGTEWAHQDRWVGDCDGDGVGDDFLCAYFEGDNADKSTVARTDTYARDAYSAAFNDQVRVIAPLPP